MSAAFKAMFDGTCAAGCDSRIHPGDLVRYEEDQLVHDVCAPKLSRLDIGPREVVCGVCWLVKPCRCDE